MVDNKLVHWINQRPERSPQAERFIRLLDDERETAARLDSSKQWRERKRMVPSSPKISPFRVLPEDMPIDYFEPSFYNRLQPRLRARVTNNTIALLPNVEETFRGNADERLSDRRFNDKYGSQVLSKYNIPLEGEGNSESDSEDSMPDEDGMSLDGDDDAMQEGGLGRGGPEVTAQQNRLAASLSTQMID